MFYNNPLNTFNELLLFADETSLNVLSQPNTLNASELVKLVSFNNFFLSKYTRGDKFVGRAIHSTKSTFISKVSINFVVFKKGSQVFGLLFF